jgi:dynein heavy chain
MLVAAMGTPGGGRSFITPRFQRHFNVVAFTNFDDAAMTTIFRSILKWFFRSGGFVPEVANMEQKLVSATLKVYDKIQADLKPTPAKTHYTFNLRDFSKVICGICLTTKKEVTSQDTTIRLWAHECCRIFGDRLINNSDRMWMLDTVREISRNPFGANFDTLFAHLDTDKDGKVKSLDEFRGLLFGDIMAAYGMADRPY